MADIRSYLTKGKTGQIIIKFKGEAHLCKLYVEDGEVIYLSCGRRSGEEVLNSLSSAEIEAVNFIEGIKPPKRLDKPVTSAVLEKLENILTTVSPVEEVSVEKVESSKVDALIEDFIDIVGPLGTVIVDNALKDLGYSRGQDMDGGSFSKLVQILADEIPEQQRPQFKAKYIQ